jgi:hypothetical protein
VTIQGARQGFALALAEGLSALSAVPLGGAAAIVGASLDPLGEGVKGGEANDHLLGHLFGLGAVSRAILAREGGGAAEKANLPVRCVCPPLIPPLIPSGALTPSPLWPPPTPSVALSPPHLSTPSVLSRVHPLYAPSVPSRAHPLYGPEPILSVPPLWP